MCNTVLTCVFVWQWALTPLTPLPMAVAIVSASRSTALRCWWPVQGSSPLSCSGSACPVLQSSGCLPSTMCLTRCSFVLSLLLERVPCPNSQVFDCPASLILCHGMFVISMPNAVESLTKFSIRIALKLWINL